MSGLYHEDDIAARIVEYRPREALRRGYEVCVEGDEDGSAGRALKEAAGRLEVNKRVLSAWIWGRLYGGSLCILGANDRGMPDEPLAEERVESLSFLNVVDRRFVFTQNYYDTPMAPKYGEPRVYSVGDPQQGGVSYVDETRTVRFDGAIADQLKTRELGGWSLSVLQRPYDVMRQFAQGFQSTAHLLTDASQGVFKMTNLLHQIAADPDLLRTRMQIVDMSKSTARSVLIDKESEEYDRLATSFAGVPDVLDRFMMRLAAAAEMPVTLLLGRSPAGQNATGESDFRAFYDSVASDQTNVLLPVLLRIYRLLAVTLGIDPNSVEIEFNPLWAPSDAERAGLELQIAQRDKVYIDAGVWLPEEVAFRIAKGGLWAESTDVDEESLKTSAEQEYSIRGTPEAAGATGAAGPDEGMTGATGAPEESGA